MLLFMLHGIQWEKNDIVIAWQIFIKIEIWVLISFTSIDYLSSLWCY